MIKFIAAFLIIYGGWGIYKEISFFYTWAHTGKYHEGYSPTQELEKQIEDNYIPKSYKNALYISGIFISTVILFFAYLVTFIYVKQQGPLEITAIISLGYITITAFIESFGILHESLNMSGNTRLIWDLALIFFEIIVYIYIPISVITM